MSLHDYRESCEISLDDPPFYALIMAALRQADTPNLAALTRAFPEVADEFARRYNAPAGVLPEEDPEQRGPRVAIVSSSALFASDDWRPERWVEPTPDQQESAGCTCAECRDGHA